MSSKPVRDHLRSQNNNKEIQVDSIQGRIIQACPLAFKCMCTRAQMGIHTHRYVQLSARVLIRHLQRFACVIHLEREGTHFPLGRLKTELEASGRDNPPALRFPKPARDRKADTPVRRSSWGVKSTVKVLHTSAFVLWFGCTSLWGLYRWKQVLFSYFLSMGVWLTDKLTNVKQHRTCLLREEIVSKVSLRCELPWIYKTEALALSGPSYGSTLSME